MNVRDVKESESTGEPSRARIDFGWAVIGLFIICAGAVIILARSFLMPVMLAFLLSLTFSPVRRVGQRRGIPPGITAAVVVVGLTALSVVAAVGLAGPIQTYAEDAPQIARDVEAKLRGISEAVEKVADAGEQVEEMAQQDGDVAAREVVVADNGPNFLTQAATALPSVMAQTLLTLVMLFFLIASGDMFYEKIVAASPTFKDKRRAIDIVFDIEKKISRYFLTIAVINACLGLAVGLVLWLLGMPNAPLFGVMAFVLNFVPYVGALGGVFITFAIGIVTFDTVGQAALCAAAYLALTSVEGQLVTPYAVGRSLKLNPVVVFLAVAFWGWAWSVVGMVVAVPLLIVIRAFSERVDGMKGLALFLAGRDAKIHQEAAENDANAAEDAAEKRA